jgi:uncharacterized protein
LASDNRWYPPNLAAVSADHAKAPIRSGTHNWIDSRWGFGDVCWGLLAFVVANIAIGVFIAVVLVASNEQNLNELQLGPYAIAVSILGNVVAFVGVPWLATRTKGLRSLSDDFGLRFRPIDLAVGVGVGLGSLVLATIVRLVLDNLLGAEEQTSNLPIDELNGVGQFVAIFVAVAIVTPIIEELFFRGLLYRTFLKHGTNRTSSITLTTLLFTLPHLLAVPSWPGVAILFGSIAVFGLAFNLACHWTGNRLGASIVAHIVINGTAILALYLS